MAAAQFAERLRESEWAGDVTFRQLAGMAWDLAEQLGEDPQVSEMAGLLGRAAERRR